MNTVCNDRVRAGKMVINRKVTKLEMTSMP